ncbi:MAG: RNA methyltransferase [Alphaproteobacteria bacterium]|nr:MAG: RNA methyltransferase [Alphaproteobacteria bacterium]
MGTKITTTELATLNTNTPVVLCIETQLSQNIGTVARAMLNFGWHELRLIAPLSDHVNSTARGASAGADIILENAKVYPDIPTAIGDLHSVFGTSDRVRDMTKPLMHTPEAMHKTLELIKRNSRVGILFGREKSGLTNTDLSYVDTLIQIPTWDKFSSLNLAQAVTVVASTYFTTASPPPSEIALEYAHTFPAQKKDIVYFFDHLERALDASGFLRIAGKREVMVRHIRNMFLRCQLSDQEVRTLHGIVAALSNRPMRPRSEDS